MLKQEAECELPDDESCPKHTKISRKSIIQNSFCALYNQCRAPSMLSAVSASSVLGRMYDVKQRVNLKRHINKGKAIGSTLKISD